MYIIKGKKFTKNFYYNKTSILKLIYLYNYINKIPFIDDLSDKIINNDFLPDQAKTELLIKLYNQFFPECVKLEFPFGFVRIFEGSLIIFFKIDFDFKDFVKFFFQLESDYKIKGVSIEVFDKNFKIFEIFSKGSFLRDFRGEVDNFDKKTQLTNVKSIQINCETENFLSFVKEYDSKNLKLIVHFTKLN